MKTQSLALLNRVDARLAACAAIATAGTALTAVPADAAIIYSGPVSLNIQSSIDGIYLNVLTNTSGTSGGTVAGWDINPYGATTLNMFTPTGGGYVGSGANYFNLAPGAMIGVAQTFGTGVLTISATTPLNFNSSNNYIGFRFLNESTGITNYGWFQVSLSGTAASQPRTIIGYAYDNTGASIMAGQTVIPEPTTFALLGVMAAGALGVRVWRGRKAA